MLKEIISKIFHGFLWFVLYFFPVRKNRILVSNFSGMGYGDNPKYIIEALLKINPNLEIIWIVKDKKMINNLPQGIKGCVIGSISHIYYLTTSIIWIDNHRKKFRYKKKKQFYLQTWHGGGIVKKVESQIAEYLDSEYITTAKKDAKYTDVMVSDGRMQSQFYFQYYWFEGLIAETGAPRNDCLFTNDNSIIVEKVKKHFSIKKDTRLLLYAPTFRRNYTFEYYNIDYESVLSILKEKYGSDFVVLVKLHPGLPFDLLNCSFNTNIINASTYPDMQELIVSADIMISDYSSVMFDFALTRKPCFRYAVDFCEYSKDRGGLCFDISEYPYPLAENNKELLDAIKNFSYNDYENKLDIYLNKIGEKISNHASNDCAKIINDYLVNNFDKNKVFSINKDILVDKSILDN